MLSPDDRERGGFITGYVAAMMSESYEYRVLCRSDAERSAWVHEVKSQAEALYDRSTDDGRGSSGGDPERGTADDSALVPVGHPHGHAEEEDGISARWSGAEVWCPVQEDGLGLEYPGEVRPATGEGPSLTTLGKWVMYSIPLWLLLTFWLGV